MLDELVAVAFASSVPSSNEATEMSITSPLVPFCQRHTVPRAVTASAAGVPASGLHEPSRLKLGLKSYIVCSDTRVVQGTSTGVDDDVALGSVGSVPGVGVELSDGMVLGVVGAGSGVVQPVSSADATSRADADVTRTGERRAMPPFWPRYGRKPGRDGRGG